MDCKDCAEKPKGAVPFAAYETELARFRHLRAYVAAYLSHCRVRADREQTHAYDYHH